MDLKREPVEKFPAALLSLPLYPLTAKFFGMKIQRATTGRIARNFFWPLRLVLPILLLGGCSTVEKITTTPPVQVVQPLPSPPAGALAIPVEILVETLRRQLEVEARKQTVAAGETPVVSGILTVPCEFKKIRVRSVVYDTVTQTKRVHKIVRWTYIIPHWGWVDAPVETKVPRMVFSVVDEGQPFSGEFLNRFVETVTNQATANFVIHYEATLGKIENLSINGDKLSATFLYDWKLGADLKSLLPAGAKTGGLAAKGMSAIKVKAVLGIENAKLKISFVENEIKADARDLEIPGVGVNLVPLVPLNETMLLAEKTLAMIGDQFPLEQAGEKVRAALQKLGRPAAIETNLFLDVAISALEIGPPAGVQRAGGTFLVVPVGLQTPIRVAFAATKPSPYQAYIPIDLPVRVTEQARLQESFQLVGDVALGSVMARMDSAFAESWKENNYSRKGYELAPVRLWETEGRRFVISIPIRKKKSGEDFAVLYAWGIPRVIEDNANPADPKLVELRMDDLDWNPETKNLLAQSFSWLDGDKLLSVLQNTARIPLAGLETQIREHSARQIKTGSLSLVLNLQSHRVADFTIAGNVLRVTLNAIGGPSITVK